MSFKKFFWILPFLSFLFGYVLFERIFHKPYIAAPSITGKRLLQAICLLSDNNLSLKIIGKKEDSDLPSGTILNQTPIAGRHIKPQQAIFVVISEKPQKIPSPHLISKHKDDIENIVEKLHIRNKNHFFQSNKHPKNTCIAQTPTPQALMKRKNIITYIANNTKKPVILPNFIDKKITDIMDFLQHYNIHIDIIHTTKCEDNHCCDEQCIITDQRPLAGSIVTLDDNKKLSVHLQVKQQTLE